MSSYFRLSIVPHDTAQNHMLEVYHSTHLYAQKPSSLYQKQRTPLSALTPCADKTNYTHQSISMPSLPHLRSIVFEVLLELHQSTAHTACSRWGVRIYSLKKELTQALTPLKTQKRQRKVPRKRAMPPILILDWCGGSGGRLWAQVLRICEFGLLIRYCGAERAIGYGMCSDLGSWLIATRWWRL